MKKHWMGKVFLFILAIIGFGALAGLVVMWLWNWLMPALFGLTTITFAQALGLFALSKILFGGFKGRGGGMRGGPKGAWGRRFREKWANMSEEEREKFRRCGGRHWGMKAGNETETNQ